MESVVYLGIDPSFASPSASLEADIEQEASNSAKISVSKVVILNPPTGFLRVRGGDSISFLEIGRVLPGEVYDLISEKDGWYEIKFNEDKIGWISSQYSRKQ